MEGAQVYSKTKLKTPRSIDNKSAKKKAADDESDEDDENTKKNTKKLLRVKSVNETKMRTMMKSFSSRKRCLRRRSNPYKVGKFVNLFTR